MSAAPEFPTSFEPDPLDADMIETIATGGEPKTPWRIDSIGAADWALCRVAEARAELARIDAHAAESKARIDAWRVQAGKRAERTVEWFEGHLIRYAASQRTEHAKTCYLPNGSVASTHHKAKVVVVDEPAAVAWAKDNAPKAVKVKESIVLGALRDAVAIQPLMVGERFTIRLSCGHTDVFDAGRLAIERGSDPFPEVGEDNWVCYNCPEAVNADGDDAYPMREVLKVESEPLYVQTVFGPDGEAIPETVLAIEDEHIDFTVKPDLS